MNLNKSNQIIYKNGRPSHQPVLKTTGFKIPRISTNPNDPNTNDQNIEYSKKIYERVKNINEFVIDLQNKQTQTLKLLSKFKLNLEERFKILFESNELNSKDNTTDHILWEDQNNLNFEKITNIDPLTATDEQKIYEMLKNIYRLMNESQNNQTKTFQLLSKFKDDVDIRFEILFENSESI
jgi:hypothetical protein